MKINDLTNNLKSKYHDVKNKDVIDFLNNEGFKISSHLQKVNNEMLEAINSGFDAFMTSNEISIEEEPLIAPSKEYNIDDISMLGLDKKFSPEDDIICRSVCPYRFQVLSSDGKTIYHWSGFGEIQTLKYKDLLRLKRRPCVTDPMFVIEDEALVYQWRKELNGYYDYFLNVDYPEDFFQKSDADFEKLLKGAPKSVKSLIAHTAISMIKNENYPTVQKVKIIDSLLGTTIQDFLTA